MYRHWSRIAGRILEGQPTCLVAERDESGSIYRPSSIRRARKAAVPIVFNRDKKIKRTTAWIRLPDFRDVCKAVDLGIRAEFGGVFAGGRTLDKAMDHVNALSDLHARGNSRDIAEWCGHATPGPVQSLIGENKRDAGAMRDRIASVAGRLAEKDCANDPLGPGVIVDETAQVKRGMATAVVISSSA